MGEKMERLNGYHEVVSILAHQGNISAYVERTKLISRLVNVLYRTELRRLLAQDALADMPQYKGTVERMKFYLIPEINMSTVQRTTLKTNKHATVTRVGKNNAIKLLKDDHAKVKKMFKEFEKLCKKDDNEAKGELVAQICAELTVHTQLEEEIFYPAAREAIDDDDLMNEALVEHASAKDLIAQIQAMRVSDPMYAAVVTVLGEYINHHVEEEQNELFPKVQKTKIDLEELGTRMANLKETLQKE